MFVFLDIDAGTLVIMDQQVTTIPLGDHRRIASILKGQTVRYITSVNELSGEEVSQFLAQSFPASITPEKQYLRSVNGALIIREGSISLTFANAFDLKPTDSLPPNIFDLSPTLARCRENGLVTIVDETTRLAILEKEKKLHRNMKASHDNMVLQVSVEEKRAGRAIGTDSGVVADVAGGVHEADVIDLTNDDPDVDATEDTEVSEIMKRLGRKLS
jgi:hypothetical protein